METDDHILNQLTKRPGEWLTRAEIAKMLKRADSRLQAYESERLKRYAANGSIEERQNPQMRNRYEYRVKRTE